VDTFVVNDIANCVDQLSSLLVVHRILAAEVLVFVLMVSSVESNVDLRFCFPCAHLSYLHPGRVVGCCLASMYVRPAAVLDHALALSWMHPLLFV